MGRFVHAVAFNAGGYFQTDRQAWVCGDFSVSLSSSMPNFFGLGYGQDAEGFSNIGVSSGCSHYFYTKVCSQITSGLDLCDVGTSKLISQTNR